MLKHIASVYGGTVIVTSGPYQCVQWTVNNATTIRNSIIPLLTLFPPLTTRITLQFSFLIKAMSGMTVQEYMLLRSDKYSNRPLITPLFTTLPLYFGS